MAVRADLGYITKQLVTALKAITTPSVYTAAEEVQSDETLWAVLARVGFEQLPRVSGTDQPDAGRINCTLHVHIRPDRARADGLFALPQAAGVVAAKLDELDVLDATTTHRLEMKRCTVTVETEVGEGDMEITYARVDAEGLYSRTSGSSLQAYMNEDVVVP